jgi:hypothetical protein
MPPDADDDLQDAAKLLLDKGPMEARGRAGDAVPLDTGRYANPWATLVLRRRTPAVPHRRKATPNQMIDRVHDLRMVPMDLPDLDLLR